MANTVGIQLYSLRNYEGGWEAAFEAVRSLGIDTIEPWCGAVPASPSAADEASPAGSIEKLGGLLERFGFGVTCGHMTIDEFDARRAEWSRFLVDHGSKHWVVPFAKADDLDGWLALLPKFREMEAALAKEGLKLGYHNHHMELEKIGDRYVMEHLLDGMPSLYAQFHIGQFLPSRGAELPDWIRKYEGRVCALHVNDSNEDGPTRIGEGVCRAEESVNTALDTGVDTFIVEVDLTRDSLEGVKRDIEWIRAVVG